MRAEFSHSGAKINFGFIIVAPNPDACRYFIHTPELFQVKLDMKCQYQARLTSGPDCLQILCMYLQFECQTQFCDMLYLSRYCLQSRTHIISWCYSGLKLFLVVVLAICVLFRKQFKTVFCKDNPTGSFQKQSC